ncbi:hypothetical protein JOF41_000928 [Saccharothrix coeruleofusca]|uniref:hypothetical protein n=1 Tax=Saccharothrix coeruleofusca TaxID=33919 RepID=UPI001AE37071|nr:hypothetical protein [Saccharothrix coeruleofusca]MBP2334750.1 hypothetical protein [Saccharothrix coeruleofusca]
MTDTMNGGRTRATGAATSAALPDVVNFELEPARRFAEDAARQYRMCLDSRGDDGVPTHRPRASALLFGQVCGAEITIGGVEFVPNIRSSDETVVAEFEAEIVPRFGEAYRNPERGFWCDEREVLRAVMRQADNGLELLGSVHSHPDWHRIGPPHERRLRLSENPTQMDDYLFRRLRWPVNVIWYVSGGDAGATHRVAGWRPGPERCEQLDVRLPRAIADEFALAPPISR